MRRNVNLHRGSEMWQRALQSRTQKTQVSIPHLPLAHPGTQGNSCKCPQASVFPSANGSITCLTVVMQIK